MEFYQNFSLLVHAGDDSMRMSQKNRKNVGRQRSFHANKDKNNTKLCRRVTWTTSSALNNVKVSFGDYLWLHLQVN